MLKLREALERFEPCNEQEARDRQVMLWALDSQPSPLTRDNPLAHFTASSWIVNPNFTRALMVHHNIYNTWAWTGGHNDGEEYPLAVALREAKEETGAELIEPVSEEIYSVEILPVPSHVKRGAFVSAHMHMNVTFLLRAEEGQPLHRKADENSGVKWFPLDQAADNKDEPFMAVIYKKLNGKLDKYRKN